MLKKNDIIAAAIIAEIDAWLFMAIFKNLQFDFALPVMDVQATAMIKFLPIILPVGAVVGLFVADFIGKKIAAIFQMYKFLLTGTLNTFIDLGILNGLMFIFSTTAGLGLSAFKAFSFSAAVINSYFLNKFWTFKKKDTKANSKEFITFYALTGIGLLINVGIFTIIVNIMGPQFGFSPAIWANVAAIIATVSVCLWNFLGYKFIIFKR